MSRSVLLTCEGLAKSFGSRTLFKNISFSLFERDHVGLVGPNGSGKSTLLKIIAGVETADGGIRALRKDVRVGYVPQDPVFAPGKTPEEVVIAALDADHHLDEYEKMSRAAMALSKAGFEDREMKTDVLSGGWRKRLAIAREMALEPDVLLLDEPTNHLDVEAILWLESLLISEPKAFVVVSHDRYFLENIAKRMLELNPVHPDGLLQVEGKYSQFLVRRDELLRNEQSYQESLANLVRREVEWLQRGAKARTTKSKARIQSANSMIEELDERRSRVSTSTASIDFTSSERRTKRLWVGKGLSKAYEGRTIFRDLDLLLSPGARIGVLGPNGSGKTTLLRVITGELQPDQGTVEAADRLRIVYFEQNREALDPEKSLRRSLAPEGDTLVFRDRPMHVAAWAKRFLFRGDQLDMKVSQLSGGEKARVLIAQLMMQPADVLILDEPTNDLDIPTLDVLEESLLEFPGALVLVTHDRYLLDRVSTQILALDGTGGTETYADYSQWESDRALIQAEQRREARTESRDSSAKKKKLTYNEQREWEAMEANVTAAEGRRQAAMDRSHDPAISSDSAALQKAFAQLQAAEDEVARLYARWAELEAKQ